MISESFNQEILFEAVWRYYNIKNVQNIFVENIIVLTVNGKDKYLIIFLKIFLYGEFFSSSGREILFIDSI